QGARLLVEQLEHRPAGAPPPVARLGEGLLGRLRPSVSGLVHGLPESNRGSPVRGRGGRRLRHVLTGRVGRTSAGGFARPGARRTRARKAAPGARTGTPRGTARSGSRVANTGGRATAARTATIPAAIPAATTASARARPKIDPKSDRAARAPSAPPAPVATR